MKRIKLFENFTHTISENNILDYLKDLTVVLEDDFGFDQRKNTKIHTNLGKNIDISFAILCRLEKLDDQENIESIINYINKTIEFFKRNGLNGNISIDPSGIKRRGEAVSISNGKLNIGGTIEISEPVEYVLIEDLFKKSKQSAEERNKKEETPSDDNRIESIKFNFYVRVSNPNKQ